MSKLQILRDEIDVDEAAGGWRGAPASAHIGWKVLATTVITTIIWIGAFLLITSSWLSFRTGWLAMPNN